MLGPGKSWQRKVRPCLATIAACNKWPYRDCRSCLVQERFSDQCCRRSRRRASFSDGSRSSNAKVSMRIPRNSIIQAGPSVLWAATGMCSVLNSSSRILRLVAPSSEFGEPRSKKKSHQDNVASGEFPHDLAPKPGSLQKH